MLRDDDALNPAMTAKPQDGSSRMQLPLHLLSNHRLFKLSVSLFPLGMQIQRFAQQSGTIKSLYRYKLQRRGEQKRLSNIPSHIPLSAPLTAEACCSASLSEEAEGSSFLRYRHIQLS